MMDNRRNVRFVLQFMIDQPEGLSNFRTFKVEMCSQHCRAEEKG